MIEPITHTVADGTNDPAANYSRTSLLVHWLAALAVIILFLTHESDWLSFHIALGVLLTIPLIARVVYRWRRGFPRPHDQHPSLNLLARLVMISMLISIFLVTISGLFLPFFEAEAYRLFGLGEWKAPFGGSDFIADLLENIHDVSGHVIIPLFALHLIGFLKHRFIDRSANKGRMLKGIKGGK